MSSSGSLEWKFNVVIKPFSVGVSVSQGICVLRINHGAFKGFIF
jgi:hypothetical protein